MGERYDNAARGVFRGDHEHRRREWMVAEVLVAHCAAEHDLVQVVDDTTDAARLRMSHDVLHALDGAGAGAVFEAGGEDLEPVGPAAERRSGPVPLEYLNELARAVVDARCSARVGPVRELAAAVAANARRRLER
jgi:hypothetical protein